MNAKPKAAFCMICKVFAAGVAIAQTKGNKPAAEPTAFYEDCDDNDKDRQCLFDHPVPLPGNVVDALRATEEARDMQDELKDYDQDDFAHLFKAVVIHLGNPEEINYVLLSEYPIGGADAPWFWIVRFDQAHPKVIFFTFANGFEILNAEHNRYPDIRSFAYAGGVTFTEVYQYNGQRYAPVHKYHKRTSP